MIDRHWDGIAAYCRPENKVALGFVEGLNNKSRVLERRAYGLRDEEYLRLKILTCMLRALWPGPSHPNVPNITHTNPRRPIIVWTIPPGHRANPRRPGILARSGRPFAPSRPHANLMS